MTNTGVNLSQVIKVSTTRFHWACFSYCEYCVHSRWSVALTYIRQSSVIFLSAECMHHSPSLMTCLRSCHLHIYYHCQLLISLSESLMQTKNNANYKINFVVPCTYIRSNMEPLLVTVACCLTNSWSNFVLYHLSLHFQGRKECRQSAALVARGHAVTQFSLGCSPAYSVNAEDKRGKWWTLQSQNLEISAHKQWIRMFST